MSKHVAITTAQINKHLYDSFYFVLLGIIVIVVLSAPSGRMLG
jgi:hypothetical protein